MAHDPGSHDAPAEHDLSYLSAIQEALIAWYGEHARDLPWRRTRDPYLILVSEVMLQQIQVARAIPFYEAFVARFPTVRDLAAAPIAEVIRVWGDLGRYRRIVALHRTARLIVETFSGKVPSDVATLRTLPGVGPYTAGAVACFAFEQAVGFLDTNSRRVLHRLFVGPELPEPSATERDLQAIAERAVPAGRAWVWNQALIEFGALRCAARRPGCDGCPVRVPCRAHPAIVELAAARQPRPPAKSVRYEGTNRYYRGRVLAALRALPDDQPGLDLERLGTSLRPDFQPDQTPWLYELVNGLTKDGLAQIAEERPAYDAGSDTGSQDIESLGKVKIRLP